MLNNLRKKLTISGTTLTGLFVIILQLRIEEEI